MDKPAIRALGTIGPIVACIIPLLVEAQASANPLTWAESPRQSQALQWNSSGPAGGASGALPWKSIVPSQQVARKAPTDQPLGSSPGPDPSTPDGLPAAEAAKSGQQAPWIIGLGGGVRIGTGEPTYPMVYARLGHRLDPTVSLSLRPRYIFGNSDLQGRSNNEGSFEIPLTLDIKANSWLSPYLGGGIATNTDSTGQTNGMISLGTDISISRNLVLDIGVNYIFQSSTVDDNGGDFELSSALYLRF